VADLTGSFLLDTGDAENAIEALGPLFDGIVGGFAQALAEALDQLTDIPVTLEEPDTAPVTEAIATAMEAGASDGAAAIETAVAGIEPEPVEIPVEADTSEAEASIEALGDSAADASVSVGGLTDSTAGLSAASGLATGSAAGLGSAVEGMGGSVGIAAGAFVAGAGVIAAFFNEAVDAQGAAQRFAQTFGGLADSVENLRAIDGLNTNLSELAITLGSDDDALRNAAASAAIFQEASGRGSDDAARFAQQIAVLAARAVALNPGLGSVGDAAERLTAALASGRERALLPFQLGLSQAQIKAEALRLGLADTAEELTRADIAFAGASIAAAKFGGTIEETITKGSENAVIQQRRLKQEILETFEALGAPLVAPIFDLLERGQPIVEAVGRVFVSLGRAALPTLIAALDSIVPLLDAFADVLETIPPELLATVAAVALLGPGLGGLLGALNAIDPQLAVVAISLGLLAKAFVGVSAASAGTTAAMGPIGAGLVAFGAAFTVTTTILRAVSGGAEDLTDDLANVDAAIRKVTTAANSGLVPAFRAAVAAQALLLAKQGNVGSALTLNAVKIRQFTEVAETDLGTAIRLAEQYRTNMALYASFQGVIVRVAQAQRDANVGTEAATALIEGQRQAVEALVSSIGASVPQAGQVFDDFTADVQRAFGEETIPTIEGFVARLNETRGEIAEWLNNIRFLIGAGFPAIAQLIASQEPGIGNAIVGNFTESTPEVQRAFEEQAAAGIRALTEFQGTADALTKTAAEQVLGNLATLPPGTESTLAGVNAALAASGIPQTAEGLGTDTASQFTAGVEQAKPGTENTLSAVAAIINQASSELGSPARITGLAIGSQLGAGIFDGLHSWADDIAAEAARIVRNAATAAREEGETGSPSKLVQAGASSVDQSFHAGPISIVAPSPETAARATIRELRALQHLGGRG
jgi:hypothetical protein